MIDTDAALAWCNEIRAELGREPVTEIAKGIRHDDCYCPIANTIGDAQNPSKIQVLNWLTVKQPSSGYLHCLLPNSVLRFINSFDRGELPEYEEAGNDRRKSND